MKPASSKARNTRVGADGAGSLPARFVQNIADRDLGPRLSHQPRGFRADPARRPGDQRHLAVETVHFFSSLATIEAGAHSREPGK